MSSSFSTFWAPSRSRSALVVGSITQEETLRTLARVTRPEFDVAEVRLDELMAAARRGVRVRLLVDQLSALRQVDTLAALASAHVNFEIRIYNPLLHRARITYPMYAWAAACCWRRLNQRMHG